MNVLTDGDFEATGPLIQWWTEQGTLAIENTVVHGGFQAGQLVPTPDGGAAIRSAPSSIPLASLSAGVYCADAWVNSNAPAAVVLSQVRWPFGRAPTLSPPTGQSARALDGDGGWIYLQTPPYPHDPGDVEFQVAIDASFTKPLNAGDAVYVDDVRVWESVSDGGCP